MVRFLPLRGQASDSVDYLAAVRGLGGAGGFGGLESFLMARCRDCHWPVTLVKMTGSGRFMAANPAEQGEGNVVARQVGNKFYGHVLRAGESAPVGWRWFLAHAAICEIRALERRDARNAARAAENAAGIPLVLFDVPKFQTR